MTLDETDRALLTLLQVDGRLTNAELAERVGLSPSACHRRVRALEARGIVTGYAALVDADAVGRGLTVLVLVTLENQRRETMQAFETAVEKVEEVMDCYLTTGAEDYLLRLMVRDARDYERVHRERLSGLPGVARLVSNIAMRKVFTRTAMPLSAGQAGSATRKAGSGS
ncbi:leucine-responsive regulatory protein [Glycocaulis alkaliphilus]|uniref:Leucine-responsive regulatory protein n=1 Tax=Glycocaulis alkaliphilus TaxID=1434191 RepID=A0A3T0E8N8_9PROT|nr:Lrp/AsnC family transcriptional regulator [Glycocaulis alkaliphilus]AZU03556.1 leucine-responsive regulatory protein [Glycocaulis alkaliphilus]GGB74418.1 AsnC family transcriptional regulator [Glycocaulis alkaliphilus]